MSVLMLSIIAVNLINYLNNMVLRRLLGPAEYSAYAALMALFLIVNLLPLTWRKVSARIFQVLLKLVPFPFPRGLLVRTQV